MEEKKAPTWDHNQDMNLDGIKKLLESMKEGAEKTIEEYELVIKSKQAMIDNIKGKK